MSTAASSGRSEVRAQLQLSGPILVNLVGMVLMVSVDMVMVGRLGEGGLGAVALSNAISVLAINFGTLSLSVLRAVVSRASSEQGATELPKLLAHGVVVAIVLSVPVIALLLSASWIIPLVTSQHGDPAVAPSIVANAAAYAGILAVGVPFGMVYTAVLWALRGVGWVKPGMVIVVIANGVNLAGNWLLIFGNLGFPRLGVVGSAWSTTGTRMAMMACALAYVAWTPTVRARFVGKGLPKIELATVRQLLRLGVPIGARSVLEGAAYSASVFLIARLGATQLAVNQVVLNVVQLVGMSSAAIAMGGSIRVGMELAAKRPETARASMVTAFRLCGALAAGAVVAIVLYPGPVMAIYSDDPRLLIGAAALRWGALFVLIDALARVAQHMLVTLLDTTLPAVVSVLLFWLVGLPLGAVLAAPLGLGATGMWVGFCGGNGVLLLVLVQRCFRKFPAAQA